MAKVNETTIPTHKFRAIVVGTGFGGAVAACRLSEAGFAPLVLERGRRYEEADFPALPHTGALLPDFARWTWQQSQGLWDIEDLDEVVSVQAAGYGGGSLIYANVHLRAPDEVFDEHWPAQYRTAGGVRPLELFYDIVASMIDPAPMPLPPGVEAPKTLALEKVEKERAFVFRPPLAIYFDPDKREANPLPVLQQRQIDARGREQAPCRRCGACCSGCPFRAKSTLDFNYLAEAERNGAVVRTECEVVAIDRVDGGWAVEYLDHISGERVREEAESLFLCAGTVHSTRLLAEWQVRYWSCRPTPPSPHGPARCSDQRIPDLRAMIGLGYFPNADALGMVYQTRETLSPAKGPTITTTAVHRPVQYPSEEFFMIQDGGYAVELDRLLGVLRAPMWARRNRYPNKRALDPEERVAADGEMLSLGDDLMLQSPVDGLLEAVEQLGGNAMPAQLAGKLLPLFQDAAAWILPDVVKLTIKIAIDRRLDWLAKLVGRRSALYRGVFRFFRCFAIRCLGPLDALGRDAATALASGGGLSRTDVATRLLGYSAAGAEQRMMLLAMGRDRVPGRLHFDRQTKRILADLDLYYLAPRYAEEELAMRDVADALDGELRVNPAWSFLGKPITVHGHGGCRMSESAKDGVTDPNGQVHGCAGLYVIDGSVLCTSVGVNPSATIAAIAERNISAFITAKQEPWPREGLKERARKWREKADARNWILTPRAPSPDERGPQDEREHGKKEAPANAERKNQLVGLAFDENMQGFCTPYAGDPKTNNALYRCLENKGRPDFPIDFQLTASVQSLSRFLEDMTHTLNVAGEVSLRLPGDGGVFGAIEECKVKGTLELMVGGADWPAKITSRLKQYGLNPKSDAENEAILAYKRIYKHPYTTSVEAHPLYESAQGNLPKSHLLPITEERFMVYDLELLDRGLRIQAYKRIREQPRIDAWRATTSLFLRLVREERGESEGHPRLVCLAAGGAHVNIPGFLKQLQSLRAFTGDPRRKDPPPDPVRDDPARTAWMISTFTTFFFVNLQRIYLPELDSFLDAFSRPKGDWRRS